MDQGRDTLGVLIFAKNEAYRIGRCLDAVGWADERLVIDDFSDDETRAVAVVHGARVVQRALDGFASQASFGLKQLVTDWVLIIDADEVVTSGLAAEIQALLRQRPAIAACSFRRMNYFLGHRMRYGGWHHDILRLFRRDRVRLTGQIHLVPKVDGPIQRLRGDTEHFPFQTLGQFIDRQNRYTVVEAGELLTARGVTSATEVRRQMTRKPAKLVLKFYIKKQGFREGMHGLIFSILFGWVHFLKWAKYWELCQQAAEKADDVHATPAVAHETMEDYELSAF